MQGRGQAEAQAGWDRPLLHLDDKEIMGDVSEAPAGGV